MPAEAGAWALDSTDPAGGAKSLRLDPLQEMTVTQVLHVPASQLTGETVEFSMRVKHAGLAGPPTIAHMGMRAMNGSARESFAIWQNLGLKGF